MSLKFDLEKELKEAIRAKDELRKRTLRMALSAVKLAEVEKQDELEDEAVLRILQKEVRSRRESIEDALKAERPDIIKEAESEIELLKEYLPQSLSLDELKTLVAESIVEVGANGPGDMGNVMKAILPKVAGRADGGQISQIVRDSLQNS